MPKNTRGTSVMHTPIQSRYHVRAACPHDLPRMERIESTIEFVGDELKDLLNLKGMQGRVVTSERNVIGYYLFQLKRDEVVLHRLAIHPSHRRHKIGSTILSNLIRDHVQGRRDRMICRVPDTAMDVHLFLKASRFRATAVERGRPDERDAYIFEFAST